MSNSEFDVQDQDEIADIQGFPFDRVALLFSVMEKCVTVAPKATSLFGIAQAEVEILNQAAKDIALRRAKKVTEADERRRQAEQERLNVEAANRDESRSQLRPRSIPAEAAPVAQPGQPIPERHIDENDHSVDPNLGAPRSGTTTTQVDRRV